MSTLRVPQAAPLVFLLGLLALGGCRAGALLGEAPGERGDEAPAEGVQASPPGPEPAPSAADVRVEPGPYAGDPRFAALAADWALRVGRALERLLVVTGLAFEEGAQPQVVLGSLGDEGVPYELRAEVREGRRRVRLLVNAEPLLGGTRRVDRVLLRALGAAAFEDAARRHGSVPRWLVALAGTAAAGDLPERLEDLRRRAHEGDPDVLRVDPEDATAAEATSLAALLLLANRGEPGEVRRLLRFVADGDPAAEVLGRIARQPTGGWVEPARLALRQRLAQLPATPWETLKAAQEAFLEAGRAGLEAALADGTPPEIAAEVRVLRARAAAAEGDHEQARALLRRLDEDAPGRLRDPAAALALRIRVESRRGGDAALARRLAGQLDRDFPRSAARGELRRKHPLLGVEEDPGRWLALTRARIAREGTDALDLPTIERYARTLLLDHRAGAAERLLEGLGDRSRAPELTGVALAVADAQVEPSDAAVRRNADRVAAWQRRPAEDTAQDVRDGGRAAVPSLAVALRSATGAARRGVIRLIAQTVGARLTVAGLKGEWAAGRGSVAGDLDHLLSEADYASVRGALADGTLRDLGLSAPAQLWSALRYGIDPGWIRGHPRFLADMRSPEYAVRREAFDLAAGGAAEALTPQLVARGLQDPAALLRREAVRAAARGGYRALARRGLGDRSWLVREEACGVLATLEGPGAAPPLIERLQGDEAIAVRRAAAAALLQVGARDGATLAALVDTQIAEDEALRELVAAGLVGLEPLAVARAIERAWAVAVRRPRPHPGFLFRTAILFQRVSGVDLGYVPGASRAELIAAWRQMGRWIAAGSERQGGRGATPGRGAR